MGGSAAIARLRADVAQVAPSCATVLITGPTGAGKENVARALHAASGRTGRFVAINCGAIPADLAESELFGTETGAYTGATRPRAGRIEAANGGTLFLDEIAELPPALQVKLLRVLETGEVERLGGHRSIRVDVRVVAATHRDLDQMVADGRFRADLFWRLAVVCLDVPPLAARPDDIPALVAHFAAWRGAALELAEDGHAALRAHPWPGNVRELRNLVDRAVAYGVRRLDAEAVCRFLAPRRRTVDAWLTTPPDPAHPLRLPHDPPLKPAAELRPVVLKALLAEAEAAIIRQALDATGGTVARSARLLGMKRTTLIDRIRRLGLSDGPPAGNA
ncbi:MAG: sigma-54 dependent transcriptional regulator [Thermaurantiacus sp.]|uniref:sigma-54 interaction domain-containing protein n=1 Tax=Thermaurantiacus sp. TaxID=2820283 RepID=UPI00298EE1CB|nr:sigma-54 dependent transcriptional regulator [Thermaurantiacus sp.]MDW8414779.1 sigma-54 dependent transcriptional regulator [Thermaurantiacus sp.]